MSGEPRGQMWVDPEGVVQLGDSYADHGAIYEGYKTQLEQLRTRYGKSWGDDDMGQAFSEKFLQGLDALDGIIGSVKGTLTYTSEGLRQGGQMYRKTDEEAAEMGHYLAGNFDNLPQGVFNRREATTEEPQYQQAMAVRGRTLDQDEAQPRQFMRATVARIPAREEQEERPAFRTTGEGRFVPPEGELRRTEAQLVFKSVRPGEEEEPTGFQSGQVTQAPMARLRGRLLPEEASDPLVQRALTREEAEALPRARFMRAETAFTGVEPVDGPMSPLLPEVGPGETAGGLRMAMPAFSASFMAAGWQDARIDGVPLADGYRLQGLTVFEDGTSRIDANRYQSITPITPGHTVTDANGQPIAAPDGALFVVKENPAVDPTAPGYEPFIVSFAPDGTAVPIVTDF